MTNCFPLYRLPQEALANVLRSMDSIDCFLFSLCSQRCKRSVAGLNLKTSQFVIAFQDFHIGMFIEFDDTSLVHVAVFREEKTAHIFNIRSIHGREATFTFGDSSSGPQCKLFVWN